MHGDQTKDKAKFEYKVSNEASGVLANGGEEYRKGPKICTNVEKVTTATDRNPMQTSLITSFDLVRSEPPNAVLLDDFALKTVEKVYTTHASYAATTYKSAFALTKAANIRNCVRSRPIIGRNTVLKISSRACWSPMRCGVR